LKQRRFVLLDRDGTIIVERHYLSDPDGVEILPGASKGMKKFQNLGLGQLVITNQSAVGRGYLDEARLSEIHAKMIELLAQDGAAIDGIFYCPHLPEEGCDCRKPLTGMLKSAASEFDFKPEECFVIGDKDCDIELGRNLGATTFLVLTGYGKKTNVESTIKPDYVVADLDEAADTIENLLQQY
jgi:D-glycero-D-manno-heptose 1,7-bisphosphate phosphatase